MSELRQNCSEGVVYGLSLSRGRPWRFVAYGDARPWLDRLASIMRLAPVPAETRGFRNLLIVRDGASLPPGAFESLPWLDAAELTDAFQRNRDQGTGPGVRFFALRGGDTVVGDIGPEASPVEEYTKMQNLLGPVFRSVMAEGGFPFHAAIVARPGGAVAIAGSGGAGKSTCARRIPLPWRSLCDDLTVIVRDSGGSYEAHPFPTWSDYFWERSAGIWDVAGSVRLRAIFFVEQADDDGVLPMGQGEAAMVINSLAAQMYQPHWGLMERTYRRSLRLRLFENAADAARVIPAYLLRVSLEGPFWKHMEEVLRW